MFMLKLHKYKLLIASLTIGLLIIAFFAFRFLTPFGAIVSYQFNSMLDRDKLSKINGSEEATSLNPGENGVLQIPQQIIRQSVVTFNLKLISKPIEGIWINLRFKNNPKGIRIGVRGSKKENYQYLPLYNQILNTLEWSKTTEGKTTFWQREKKYQDLSDLVNKPPVSDDTKIASYFFDPSDIIMKENNSSSQSNLKIERDLRGSHTLLIKVDRMPFLLNIEKQDANVYEGKDLLVIQILKNNNKIIEKEIPDDGVTDAGNLNMSPQSEKIKIENAPLGFYEIVLSDKSNGADVRITKIETNQSALVFAKNIWLYDNQPTSLWTNSKLIKIPNVSKGNAQIAKLDDKSNLDFSEPGRSYEFDLKSIGQKEIKKNQEINKLTFNKGLLNITGDGYFSFSQESFFDPEPIKTVDLSTVSDINKIDYIIANYQAAKKDGEWYTAQAYFDPFGITIDDDMLYFSLESPELNSYGGEIVIDSLEVTVKKPGWFTKPEPAKESLLTTVQKQNIVQKGKVWLGEKFNQVKSWVSNTWQQLFKKKPKTDNEGTITITNTKATPSPSPSPSLKPIPSPSPIQKITNFIRILNGGAGQGGAGEFAKVLAGAGFTNVTAETADKTDYKNAIIKYRQEDEKIVAKLEELLKKDYKTVDKQKIATTSAEIVVIIGEK
jgi:hypothetical protein